MSLISKPSNLFATKQEIEEARSGSNPALSRSYIEHLEEIAEAAIELEKWDYEHLNEIDWEPLRNALRKVYCI